MDLLLGQLLTEKAGGDPDRLRSLAGDLHEAGAIPGWLRWLLCKRPALVPLICRETGARMSRAAGAVVGMGGGGGRGGWEALGTGRTGSGVGGDGERSRYAEDFEEIKQLGKGGFGVVFKAVHRTDQRMYGEASSLLMAGRRIWCCGGGDKSSHES